MVQIREHGEEAQDEKVQSVGLPIGGAVSGEGGMCMGEDPVVPWLYRSS